MGWDNDPIVTGQSTSTAPGPWDKDPIVQAAPGPWDKDPVVSNESTPLLSGSFWSSVKPQFAESMKNVPAQLEAMSARQAYLEGGRENVFGIKVAPGAERPTPLAMPADQEQEDQRLFREQQAAGAAAGAQQKRVQAVTPPNMTWPAQVVSSAVTSALPTIAGVGIGLATKNVPAAIAIAGGGGAAMQGASTYGEAYEKTGSHQEAQRAGFIDAALEGIGEAIPLRYALKAGTPTFRWLMGVLVREGGQEMATQGMQDLHAYLTYNPDITLKEALYNMSVAAGAGTLMGGVIGGGVKGYEKLTEPSLSVMGPSGEVAASISMRELQASMQEAIKKDTSIPEPDEKPPVKTAVPTTTLASISAGGPTPSEGEVAKLIAELQALDTAKQNAATKQVNPVTATKLIGLNELKGGDIGEAGESRKVTSNAKNYANENDAYARTDRPLWMSTDPDAIVGEGSTLGATNLKPGHTYVVGYESEDRPGWYLTGLGETLHPWQQKYLPNSTILIMNESGATDTAVGWHSMLPTGVHVITPATLRAFTEETDPKKRNVNAQFKTWVNLAHEFGHAIMTERFMEGVEPALRNTIFDSSTMGLVPEEYISQLPENLAAVVKEFNAVKQGVLDGSMTANEFRLRWMNPHKIHKQSTAPEHHVPGHAPAMQLVDAIIRRALRPENVTTMDPPQMAEFRMNYLGLHEYLAEQTARYAYVKDWARAPSLEAKIGGAIASAKRMLADFFRMLKGQEVIAPGVKFSEWLDSLGKTGEPVKAGKKAGVKKPKAAAKPKTKKAKPAPAPDEGDLPKLDHNAATDDKERALVARRAVTGLVKDGTLETGDENYKSLMAHIKNGDWVAFSDDMSGLMGKKVMFELEDLKPIKQPDHLKVSAYASELYDVTDFWLKTDGYKAETPTELFNEVLDYRKAMSDIRIDTKFWVPGHEISFASPLVGVVTSDPEGALQFLVAFESHLKQKGIIPVEWEHIPKDNTFYEPVMVEQKVDFKKLYALAQEVTDAMLSMGETPPLAYYQDLSEIKNAAMTGWPIGPLVEYKGNVVESALTPEQAINHIDWILGKGTKEGWIPQDFAPETVDVYYGGLPADEWMKKYADHTHVGAPVKDPGWPTKVQQAPVDLAALEHFATEVLGAHSTIGQQDYNDLTKIMGEAQGLWFVPPTIDFKGGATKSLTPQEAIEHVSWIWQKGVTNQVIDDEWLPSLTPSTEAVETIEDVELPALVSYAREISAQFGTGLPEKWMKDMQAIIVAAENHWDLPPIVEFKGGAKKQEISPREAVEHIDWIWENGTKVGLIDQNWTPPTGLMNRVAPAGMKFSASPFVAQPTPTPAPKPSPTKKRISVKSDQLPPKLELLDPKILAQAAKLWREMGFRSPWVKAWFGDWENHPESASKVVTAAGQPLVVFHSTQNNFWVFQRGDVGFHFGTVQAAHDRNTWQPTEEVLRDPKYVAPSVQVMAVILDIKNPWVMGREETGFWERPESAIRFLENKGFDVTSLRAEVARDQGQAKAKFDRLGPVRRFLESHGYDGIQYENVAEDRGSTSWVAFRPDQVKSVWNTGTFLRNPNMHWELDFDESTPQGQNAGRLNSKLGKFVKDHPGLRKALRYVSNMQYPTLQAQQEAWLNPDDAALVAGAGEINLYETFKGRLQSWANELADRWQGGIPLLQPKHLSKEQAGWAAKFLQAEMDSGGLWVELYEDPAIEKTNPRKWKFRPSDLTVQKMKDQGIPVNTPRGEQTAAFILDVKNSILEHINEAEVVLDYLYARRLGGNAVALQKQATVLKYQMDQIRRQPFFPRGSFGPWILTVRRKKAQGPGYEVVHREAFESEKERQKRGLEIEKRLKPDERIRYTELTESEYVMMSLPSDFIELVAQELGVTDKNTIARLHEVAQPIKVEKALSSYDRARLKIPGGSMDALRSYSNFMWHNSNLLAKMKHRAGFNYAVGLKRGELISLDYMGPKADPFTKDTVRRQLEFLQYVRDNVLYPPGELYLLRAGVALSYLALNPKTAILNLSSLMLSAADLTYRYGEVQGWGKFLKGVAQSAASMKLNDLSAVANRKLMRPELQQGLDRAIQEGHLNQSYAYHLAAMSTRPTLERAKPLTIGKQAGRHAINGAMWMFRLTELAARRAMFLASLDANLTIRKLPFEQAYQETVKTLAANQGDYGQGNRPYLLSAKTPLGKVGPLATVFATFTQMMSFHAFGGYQKGLRRQGVQQKSILNYNVKVWIALLLLAGYEGLPLAENILDVLDFIWKQAFGGSFRKEAREILSELITSTIGESYDNPSLLAHGLGHNVKIPWTEMEGMDVSRSIGFGRVFPGTDVLAKSSQTDPVRQIGEFMISVLGPFGSVVNWMLQTLYDPEAGMRRAPGALGNVWNAYYWSQFGVRAPDGGEITFDPQTGTLRELTTYEIMMKAAGFNPTIVSENRELLFAQHDMRMYWSNQRADLLKSHWTAVSKDDREAEADARDAIDRFNDRVEKNPETAPLMITGRELARSTKQHERQRRATESQQPAQRRYGPLYEDIRDAYQ